MDVLGIGAFHGPAAACLVRDGRVIAAAREEHFTRRAGDPSFPRDAIAFCLRTGKIGPSALAAIAWCGRPRRAFELGVAASLAHAPGGYSIFRRSLIEGSDDALWARSMSAREIDPGVPFHEVDEVEAAAAGAFFGSPFDAAAVVAAGSGNAGIGTMLTRGAGGTIDAVATLVAPCSPLAWAAGFATLTGIDVLDLPGDSADPSVHALARRIDAELWHAQDDGSFDVPVPAAQLRGWARGSGADMARLAGAFAIAFDALVGRLARAALARAGEDTVVLAGRLGARRPLLARLRAELGASRVWAHPACAAGVEPAGAALLVAARAGTAPARPKDPASAARTTWAFGPGYNSHQIRTVLRSRDIAPDELAPDELVDRIASLLVEGKRVGWFEGRLDLGADPVASRAILALPRVAAGARLVALEGVPADASAQASDGSLQLTRGEHRALHDLVRAVGARTGRAALAAVPLARPGEPLACTPLDAVECFTALDLDAIAMGPYIVEESRART